MKPCLRPQLGRDLAKGHRAITQLELLFDLVSVVAIASLTEPLHHAHSEGHGTAMLINFVALFAVIWWVWMNYALIASAFDSDDTLFTLLTLTIMGSAAVFAGVSNQPEICPRVGE